MATTPIEHIESLCIGSVVFVSPCEIKARLDAEAPDSVALNTGVPVRFPKVNNYLVIPSDCSYVVCQVVWAQLTQEFGGLSSDKTIVGLPSSLRILSLSPLGMLTWGSEGYQFTRGADSLPAIGESVLLPTADQVRAIVISGTNRRVWIGSSPLADNAKIEIDPDRMFGRHLAILGNTGSGKSCSVAGIIRWSIEAAHIGNESTPNARFLIFDPNGEYKTAFEDLNPTVYKVLPTEGSGKLQVPLWLLNSDEWAAVLQASGKTQKPTLINALRNVRSGVGVEELSIVRAKKQYLSVLLRALRVEIMQGVPFGAFPKNKNFGEKLERLADNDFNASNEFSAAQNKALDDVRKIIVSLLPPAAAQFKNYTFSQRGLDCMLVGLSNALKAFGGDEEDMGLVDADMPLPFSSDSFIKMTEACAQLLNTADYSETMIVRLKTLLGDVRLKSVLSPDEEIKLAEWLDSYIGGADETKVSILDLSLLPAEMIYIVTSVLARITFEALQRYRKMHPKGEVLPTVIVMEEAHTFIKRYNDDLEASASIVCCKVFERIAREGRKFGLGLVLSSQRPSELSPTVLSQCNTFLLHRISNDKDQELVRRLLPDNLHGLIRDLPVLPSRYAVLLGWASELPVLVRMRDLPKEQRPQSSDPDFWDVWTRKSARDVEWEKLANDWQGVRENSVDVNEEASAHACLEGE